MRCPNDSFAAARTTHTNMSSKPHYHALLFQLCGLVAELELRGGLLCKWSEAEVRAEKRVTKSDSDEDEDKDSRDR